MVRLLLEERLFPAAGLEREALLLAAVFLAGDLAAEADLDLETPVLRFAVVDFEAGLVVRLVERAEVLLLLLAVLLLAALALLVPERLRLAPVLAPVVLRADVVLLAVVLLAAVDDRFAGDALRLVVAFLVVAARLVGDVLLRIEVLLLPDVVLLLLLAELFAVVLREAEALRDDPLLFALVDLLFVEDADLVDLPRADPLFLPPPSCLFTVAQARRSASPSDTPRFSYPSSMCSAFRFCLSV